MKRSLLRTCESEDNTDSGVEAKFEAKAFSLKIRNAVPFDLRQSDFNPVGRRTGNPFRSQTRNVTQHRRSHEEAAVSRFPSLTFGTKGEGYLLCPLIF